MIFKGGTTDIGERIDGLATAVSAAEGRLPADVTDEAQAVVDRASSRLKLSADHTVVGIAGATGSGKSSTFNALTGLELSAVGVRRPTTSWATACVWGHQGARELLEWLGIPERHQTTRDSMLDTRRESNELDGVVLLDLPDHDSTEVAHHLEVDRLVVLADMLVWVLDPQKYADAAIHDRYLQPLRSHSDIMVVVLNHIDEVPEERRESMLADVRRLLDADGLPDVPVYGVSAKFGWGVDELRTEIARRVADKKTTRSRLEADLRGAAMKLEEVSGEAKPRSLSPARIEALDDALAESAGVPTIVDAVQRATRVRANRATGWPLISWVSALKPDPLKRLHLDLGSAGRELTGNARTSVPAPTAVQRARVDTEVRALADDAGAGLGAPWQESIRRASVAHIDDLGDGLDAAVGKVDLGADKLPVWAGLVRVVQWLLILAALGGLGWTVAAFVSGGLDDDSIPHVAGVALPLVLLIGGVGLGIVFALVCRILVAGTARSRAARADERLREAVSSVAHELIVVPVEAELSAYSTVRAGLSRALS
ncbi:GTPase family protein [Nocardioides sp. Kera G14]|uniref:GTPase family protein n=1 Tax=Nocardioides sp. Kera G14 TaxID=2884264 RepID=UPI001D0F77E6|nr:GTPase [Nocardioides sp. Kera G14]UDY24450.1 50S ribosome-binding GTPase [Nocardioides sp. Kera G14]